MHAKDGAAVIFLTHLFEILTNRKIRQPPPTPPLDFSDAAYQSTLPIHARSNTVSAIRSNIRLTETIAVKNENLRRDMIARVVGRQLADRYDQREDVPRRFGILPSIGQRCPRREPRQGEMIMKAHSATASAERMSSMISEPQIA